MSNESTKPTKVAYIIFGPESAGNRMMARSFDTVGVRSPFIKDGKYLSGPHPAPDYSKDVLLVSMSLPYGGFPGPRKWQGFDTVVQKARANYDVIYTVMLVRDFEPMAASQVRRGRISFAVPEIRNEEDALKAAKRNIKRAYSVIEEVFTETGFRKIFYEKFVTDSEYRKEVFEWFGLPEPTLEYHDPSI